MMRKRRSQFVCCTAIFFVSLIALLAEESYAFSSMPMMSAPAGRGSDGIRKGKFARRYDSNRHQYSYLFGNSNVILFASPPEKDSDSVQKLFDFDGNNFDNEMSEDDLEEIKAGQPSEWMVMKQLLGINIFTVLLAGLIIFFLSMNFTLGPGWLGSKIGIPRTGSIQEFSPSLPGTIDLNKPEYRL